MCVSHDLVNQVVAWFDNQSTSIVHLQDDVSEMSLDIGTSHLVDPAYPLGVRFFAPHTAFGRAFCLVISFVDYLDEIREDAFRDQDSSEERVHCRHPVVAIVFINRVKLPFVILITNMSVHHFELPICKACRIVPNYRLGAIYGNHHEICFASKCHI